jgi:hypothetical protein
MHTHTHTHTHTYQLDYNGLVILGYKMLYGSDKTSKSYIKLIKESIVHFPPWYEVHVKYCLKTINVLICMHFSYLQFKGKVGFLYHWISKIYIFIYINIEQNAKYLEPSI